MALVPREYYKTKGMLYHILGGSIFVFGLLLLFCPFGFKTFVLTYEKYSFHVTMVFCILLMTLLVSRLSLFFLGRPLKLSWSQTFFVFAIEVVFSAGFSGLYLWLADHQNEPYFWYFGRMMVYLTFGLAIPYIIIDMYFMLHTLEQRIKEKEHQASGEKIRFCDERDNLKLVVAEDLVLYIQAEENYLKICYLEKEELKFCTLRSSMKRIEDLCADHGLVRCHRSYFVNKHRVKALQKEKDYTYAVLDVVNANHVPVSKNYYDQITTVL